MVAGQRRLSIPWQVAFSLVQTVSKEPRAYTEHTSIMFHATASMTVEDRVSNYSPTMATDAPKDESCGFTVEETCESGHTAQSPFPIAGQSDAEKFDERELVADTTRPYKKPLSFYLAFLSLLMMVLIVSLDSTILAVALPVGRRRVKGCM